MSKPKTPKTPNYTALANQQAALSQKAVDTQTTANRPTQVSGEGTVSWTKDANGNWTQTSALNPTLAAAQTAQQGTVKDISQGVQGMAPGVIQGLQQPWDTSGAPALGDPSYAATQEVIDATMGQMRPELERQRKAQEAQNIAMGLRGGDEAYGRMQYDLGNNELNARQKAVLAGTTEAGNVFNRQNLANQLWRANSLQNRLQPISEMSGLMGLAGKVGATPGQSAFERAGLGATPDLLGAAGQQYSADMAKYNAKNQGGFWNGLLKLGGTAAGAYFGGPGGAQLGSGIADMFSGGNGGTSPYSPGIKW
jgi:hypothetical protein